MSGDSHFDEFTKGIDALASKKFPTEYELQQSALREFGDFFNSVETWDAKIKNTWRHGSVSYKFGDFDSKSARIEIYLIARDPTGRENSIHMSIIRSSIFVHSHHFKEKFGSRNPSRWEAHEMSDLLPRMTNWLLEFFRNS